MRLPVLTRRLIGRLLPGLLIAGACRAHPAHLAISLVEGYADAREVQERGGQLIGQPVESADEMFGSRHDTLHDPESARRLLVYPEHKARKGETFYMVDVDPSGRITNLLKVKFNIEGVTDLHQNKEIRAAVAGKSRGEVETSTRLTKPLRVLRSEENGKTICVHKPQGLIPKTYTDYCLLWYDARTGRCVDNAMLGVIAGFATDRLEAAEGNDDGVPTSQPRSLPAATPIRSDTEARR